MTDKSILDALNAAGEALKACGEPISISLYPDEAKAFSVGLKSTPGKYGCDVFGHAATPAEAYTIAVTKRDQGAAEAALRARIAREVEERVRAELADTGEREAA